jgi:hypothetical protein
MLVASVALFLLVILLANSYVVHSLPFDFATPMRLLLGEIPNLAFRIFRFDFLQSFLIFAFLTIGLGASLPKLIRNHFRRFGTLVTFAASLAWVQPMIDISAMLSLALSAKQGEVSASRRTYSRSPRIHGSLGHSSLQSSRSMGRLRQVRSGASPGQKRQTDGMSLDQTHRRTQIG